MTFHLFISVHHRIIFNILYGSAQIDVNIHEPRQEWKHILFHLLFTIIQDDILDRNSSKIKLLSEGKINVFDMTQDKIFKNNNNNQVFFIYFEKKYV